MVKSCFKKSLRAAFLLTLSATSLLATPFSEEDKDSRLPNRVPAIRVFPWTAEGGIEPLHKRSRLSNRLQHIDQLPEEVHLRIFSFLHQKDILPTSLTSQKWKRLMEDDRLWKKYAIRAQIILKEDRVSERNYKALVKEHCTFSFTDLGFLNGGLWSSASGISADGSVIVGVANDGAAGNQGRAFRWTSEKGMESLGTLNGGRGSWAFDISADGSVIIGKADDGEAGDQERAFRWTAEKGMESVEKILTDKGLLPAGWELTDVTAITPNGTVLIGGGKYNDGSPEAQIRAWRTVIPRANIF